MRQADLEELLKRLIATGENEIVEFKQARNDYSTDKVGKYFSALANEANLSGKEQAWLVFGIQNKTRTVVGSDYRPETQHLQGLKMQILENSDPSITFRAIHESQHPNGRDILFQIPAAPRALPIAWKGHYYARAGENLTNLGLDKLDEIRQQTMAIDRSAQVVPEATVDHLDSQAIQTARESFSKRSGC